MIIMTLPEGKIVYDLNDEGNFFYIIGKGKVVVNIQNNENNNLTAWHTFGEISLFTAKKREEVIITKESTELYIIDGESFRDIQKRKKEEKRRKLIKIILKKKRKKRKRKKRMKKKKRRMKTLELLKEKILFKK